MAKLSKKVQQALGEDHILIAIIKDAELLLTVESTRNRATCHRSGCDISQA